MTYPSSTGRSAAARPSSAGTLWAENRTGRRAEHQHSRLLLGLGRPGEDGYPVAGPLLTADKGLQTCTKLGTNIA